ncbi:MAG: hypothetical protein ACR2N3_05915 [Pyrinomonadaceae bacterium]
MIRILKQLLFITIIGICTSLSAFAQRDGDKKPPPKDPPPVVVVKPKEPDKPKNDNRGDNDKKPRKPQSSNLSALQLVGIIFD